MVPPVSDPHVQIALVSKDSDHPADWVLSLGPWNLMELTSKPNVKLFGKSGIKI